MAERLHQLQRFFLVLAGFACPLLFYTDLTRNPYYTQIAGLNILMWLCLGCWVWSSFLLKKWEIPKTVLDIPWLGWLGVCLVSGLVSYWGHAVFFRPAIFNEGFRIGLFTVSNAVLVFYWGAWIGMSKEENTSSVRGWFLFLMVWSFLWFLFPHLRKIPATPGTWDRVWDPYGGILWLGGIVMVWRLTRKGSPWDFWNLLMATGFLAAGYGILQYFGVEMVWPKRLDPYGVRAVSTFGNPNFLSSYLVVLLPMAAVFFLQARSLEEKIFYGLYFLTYEASIVSSLTRSSWLGALAALGCLGFSPACRRAFRENRKEVAVLGTLALILIFMWPTGGSSSMTVLGRVKELKEILPQARLEGPGPYSPWYQRLLIWVCCWQMGLENPLLGKGWGVLELFYPFYQGPNLLALDIFRTLRTHAN
ncbi:MAG: hypothetical protein HY400_06420, partial [Elusimicrobia bacterium]|nr:hypothetical protein [Elusimicrobiota bacterium]